MLTKALSKEQFKNIERVFRKHFHLGLEARNSQGREISRMCSADCYPRFCQLVQSDPAGLRRCNTERRRSLAIAFETGQCYIANCHAGIVLVCVPVMDKDVALGGIFFGKCLWTPVTKILITDVKKRLKDLRTNTGGIAAAMRQLPVIPGRTIQASTRG